MSPEDMRNKGRQDGLAFAAAEPGKSQHAVKVHLTRFAWGEWVQWATAERDGPPAWDEYRAGFLEGYFA